MSLTKFAAEPAVEVVSEIGVVAVDAGVDDAHQHPAAPLVDPVGAARGGVDHPHVPLLVGERLLVGHAPGARGAALDGGPLGGGQVLHLVLDAAAARDPADGTVAGRAHQGALAGGVAHEGRVAGPDGGHADPGVLFQDGAAGGLDGGSGGGRGRAVGVGDDVLAVGALELAGGLGLGGERGPTGLARALAGRASAAATSTASATSRTLRTATSRGSRQALHRARRLHGSIGSAAQAV
jgi:hypothetical protein